MNEFKRAQGETRSVEIKTFKPKSFGSGEDKPYSEVKETFGNLALTDQQSHASFRLDSSSKKFLGIEREERSQLEGMVKEEVEARINTIKDEAMAEGYSEGKLQGVVEAKAQLAEEMTPVFNQLKETLQVLDQTKDDLFRANEKVLVELMFQMNKRILLKEVAKDPDYVIRLLRDIMERVSVKENVRVLLSKTDFDNLDKVKDFLKVEYPELKNIQFDMSEALAHGGCLVETDLSRIDASVDTQMKLIADALGAP